MITRKQIADAYQCCHNTIKPFLEQAGITHSKGITLDEFREVIRKRGWPTNEKYQHMAEMAMKVPPQIKLFQ
jgi:hypothetical protein